MNEMNHSSSDYPDQIMIEHVIISLLTIHYMRVRKCWYTQYIEYGHFLIDIIMNH